MPGKALLTVSSRVDNSAILKEVRGGRDVIVIPSATLPDNIVMNKVLYPAEEIAKSFKGLENTPAPLGHPVVNNRLISANSPEGINAFWVGAHNENVRQENGRVLLDKVIDVETAKSTERGQRVLDAINQGKPIHTSTGIFMRREFTPNAEGHDAIARDMVFDHDAILLDEPGAATPDQGVGMMVNNEQGEECELIAANLEEWLDEELDHLGQRVVETVEAQQRQERWQNIKARVVDFVQELLQSEPTTNSLTKSESEEDGMALTDEQKKETREIMVEVLTANNESLSEVITGALTAALEPITKTVGTLQANFDQQEKAEREAAVKTITEAGVLEEADCEGMTINALKTLAGKVGKPGAAAPVAGAFGQSQEDDQFADVDLNANIDEAAKA